MPLKEKLDHKYMRERLQENGSQNFIPDTLPAWVAKLRIGTYSQKRFFSKILP
jgi:hypothetical protein